MLPMHEVLYIPGLEHVFFGGLLWFLSFSFLFILFQLWKHPMFAITITTTKI